MSITNFTIPADAIADCVVSAYESRRTVVFRGAPGIGKTDSVHEGARRLSEKLGKPVPVYTLHLASMSEVDLQVIMPVDGKVEMLPPVFWDMVTSHECGIIFVDELGQASPEMQKAIAPLLLDGRIGSHILPSGHRVIGATNRASDNSGVNTLLSHVLNRIVMVDVVPPSPDAWVSWAASHDLDPVMIAFARMRPDVVFHGAVPSDEDQPYCTPRSIHAASDVVKTFGGALDAIDSPPGLAMLSGAIGAAATSEVIALAKLRLQLPTIAEVIAAPLTTPIPEKLDQQYVMMLLVAMSTPIKGDALEAACQYVVRFPVNIALVGVVALCRRSSEFVMTKTFAMWARDNAEVIGKFRGFTDV